MKIIKQIRKHNPDLNVLEFKKSNRFTGFDLNRMDRIFELNSSEFKNLLEN